MNRINNQQKWEFLCPTYFTEDKGELVKLFILSDTKHLICKLIMRRKAANDVVQEAGSFPWLMTEMKKQSSKVSEVTLDAEALFIESVSLSFWWFDWKHNVTRSGWEKVDNRGYKDTSVTEPVCCVSSFRALCSGPMGRDQRESLGSRSRSSCAVCARLGWQLWDIQQPHPPSTQR